LLTEAEELLELWLEASMYLGGDVEAKIPQLKRARPLTGRYLTNRRMEEQTKENE